MDYKYLSIVFLLIISIIFFLVFAPIIDHLFYIDKVEGENKVTIFIYIIFHIILLGILIYIFHKYIVLNYLSYFKLNPTFIKIIDLILALTLTGLQRNLINKIRYLSNNHPIRTS